MRNRSKLSKIEWKYLIIDEAQRMKDRESRLSRDLDRFRCQRRLLLTGTPLQVILVKVYCKESGWGNCMYSQSGPDEQYIFMCVECKLLTYSLCHPE